MIKIVAFLLFVCLISCTFAVEENAEDEAGPVLITRNNIASISKIDIDASGVVSTNVEANIISALLAILSQQAAVVVQPN